MSKIPAEIDKVPERVFTRKQIIDLLSVTIGKKLNDIDSSGQFASHEGQTKVTGIVGDIVEVSVLGCPKDSKQEPDIIVDGVKVEIKTTGMVKPRKQDSPYVYECKEPVSITAVSIPVIIKEEFETSNFWHKLAHMLWVYYWYNSSKTVTLEGYKNFPILGFQFYEISDDDKLRLKQDWLIVRDFLIVIHREYNTQEEREAQYPRLSSELRSQLMLIDTAPKFPNSPRFRLKRSFATIIADQYFSNHLLEKLNSPITKYSDIDKKCKRLTDLYVGKSFAEIADVLGISLNANTSKAEEDSVTIKNFAEFVVLRMFGSNAKSLNSIEDFAKIGLIAKSLPLDYKGDPKESMKMFMPDFEEWMSEESFEESFMREYFAEHQILLIVYQYTDSKDKNPDHIKFVGFKRVYFTDDFIDHKVKRLWDDVRFLIKNKELRIEKRFRKTDGAPIMNPKSGTQKEAPNFPKEAEYDVFMRGSGKDASDLCKTLVINGLKMLPQEVWLAKRVTLDLFYNQETQNK